MGGGKGAGKEAENEARLARQEENARQERIRQGTKRIGQIFEGGEVTPTGRLSGGTYDPNAKYYTSTGAVWSPKTGTAPPTTTTAQQTYMPTTGDHGAQVNRTRDVITTTPGAAYADPATQFAEAVKAGLFTGTKKSTGAFGGDFFDKRRRDYLTYAMPQVDAQRGSAEQELLYALTRGGNLASSTRAGQTGDLSKLYETNKQAVSDKALEYEKGARTAVEDARTNLITTLNATGDAEGAARSAVARAGALSRPDTYSPLSQLFADFTATLGTQAAMERAEAMSGKNYARYNTGLFTPGKVVNT